MTTGVLIVGGAVSALLLVNALASFAGGSPRSASWMRLNAAALAVLATLVAYIVAKELTA